MAYQGLMFSLKSEPPTDEDIDKANQVFETRNRVFPWVRTTEGAFAVVVITAAVLLISYSYLYNTDSSFGAYVSIYEFVTFLILFVTTSYGLLKLHQRKMNSKRFSVQVGNEIKDLRYLDNWLHFATDDELEQLKQIYDRNTACRAYMDKVFNQPRELIHCEYLMLYEHDSLELRSDKQR